MKAFELAFFALASLLVLLGGVFTVAARNPIRGAMGLLSAIVGIAGLYLMLSAEFLAAIQILVYAGAVVVLFLFVIMLLGPSAQSGRDARTAVPRYLGAGVLLTASLGALGLVATASPGPAQVPAAPPGLGTVEGLGRELFTDAVIPFELSGALLLIAVVGAVAVARGKQADPTLSGPQERAQAESSPAGAELTTQKAKDVHS
ncbi:MAG TPA: NADH-quinone oxidoreductase subunit J [Candidatus Nanopelagicales bacterium]|nr:NADH-quinone oxidoreductase subunit J [Candidatus Nanopelagicales bacterium]